MAEGARLEIVCTQKVPGVRISPSPPVLFNLLVLLKKNFIKSLIVWVVHFTGTIKDFFVLKIQEQNFKGRASNSLYRSYLFSRNGVLYFRIAVPNHLQSLLKKKEIRKSLNTAKLREARPMAMRLAVSAMQYFELLEKIRADVVQFGYKNSMQLANINGDFYDFTDRFWLEAASSKENVTELLKLYLKPLGGNKAVSAETVPGKEAEAHSISACKGRLSPVSSQSVENKEENICRELGDNPAPVNAVVQKKNKRCWCAERQKEKKIIPSKRF